MIGFAAAGLILMLVIWNARPKSKPMAVAAGTQDSSGLTRAATGKVSVTQAKKS
jgi:hypothetical protein